MDKLGYIDFILLGLIILVGIRGFFSGFIREVFGFASLVLGMVFASRYAYEAGEWMRLKIFNISSPTFATLLGFIAIFLLIWIICILLHNIVAYLTKGTFHRYLNRILGCLFGLLKSFIAIAILLHFMFRMDFIKEKALEYFEMHSVIYPSMNSIASKIVATNIIPTTSAELQERIEEVKEKLDEVEEKVVDSLQNKSDISKESEEGQ